MKTILRQTYSNEEIILDNQTQYVNCTFVKCHFFYGGGDSPFVNCKLQEHTITFTGEAAKVMAFMAQVGMIQQAPPPVPPAMAQQHDSGATH